MVNSARARTGRGRGPELNRLRLATDERRAQLLALGRRLFDERPYDEISIDDIAATAGISKGLLYHYFAGKRALYLSVVRAEADRLRAATEAEGDLRAGLDTFLDYVEGRATAWSALVRGGVGADREVARIVEDTRTAIVERVARDLWGSRRPVPAALRTAVRGWQGFVEAATLDWLEDGTLKRDALRELLALALEGAVAAAHAIDPRAATAPAGG